MEIVERHISPGAVMPYSLPTVMTTVDYNRPTGDEMKMAYHQVIVYQHT
jgi:hypothetical protein